MKKMIALILSLTVMTAIASNYPSNYCDATVNVCKDGPGVFARISSGCGSPILVIGYKKQGNLGSNAFVDAVVNFQYGDGYSAKKNFRINPDWQNLGFVAVVNLEDLNIDRRISSASIAFSDGRGGWDSKSGANYNFPIANGQAASCYSVRLQESFSSQIPSGAWNVIHNALR